MTIPGWEITSMSCLRMYGTPAFHIGTLNSSRSAASTRSKLSCAARQAAACSPSGVLPPKTVILAAAAAGPKAGSEPSQRSQASIRSSGCVSRYASRNVPAICRDSEAAPRGDEEMCSRTVTGSSAERSGLESV